MTSRILTTVAVNALLVLAWFAFAPPMIKGWIDSSTYQRGSYVLLAGFIYLCARMLRQVTAAARTAQVTNVAPTAMRQARLVDTAEANPHDRERAAQHEAAHALLAHMVGVEHVHVSMRPGPGYSASTTAKLPTTIREQPQEAAWARLLIALSGNQWDLMTNNHDDRSSSDMTTVINHIAEIISTGLPPTGYDGPLTLDSLVSTGRDITRKALQTHRAAVTELGKTLYARDVCTHEQILHHLQEHRVPRFHEESTA